MPTDPARTSASTAATQASPPSTPHITPVTIRMHASDNVAIVANDGGLPAGTALPGGLTAVRPRAAGPQGGAGGHRRRRPVLRYGVPIGHALKDIPAGSWVHERLLQMPEARGSTACPWPPPGAALPPLEGYTFEGYRNADGSVGTRNILAITQTVQCVAGVVDFAVQRIKAELLPRYPNVDDVVALEHGYGCGVAIDAPDAVVPIRTLRHISLNPNFGGEVMVVSLGCEKLQPERLLPPGTSFRSDDAGRLRPGRRGARRGLPAGRRPRRLHVDGRFHPAPGRGAPAAPERAPPRDRARQRAGGGRAVRRQRCVQRRHRQPGGGLLHRPAGARRRQRDVQRDHRGARRHRPAHRPRRHPEVAEAMVREMAWYDAYLQRGSVDRSANTTPGNKAGGLSNIVEKAMGSIVKSGSAPITGVLSPGEKLRTTSGPGPMPPRRPATSSAARCSWPPA
jgi:galactarate dehydratase